MRQAEAMEPGARSLFQTINGFYEFTDMGRKLRISKARELFHVYILGQNAIQDVNLTDK